MLESIIPEFVGGLMAIVCAVIGAKMATNASEKQNKAKELREAYSDVFAGYYSCMMNMSDDSVKCLVTAIERTCLICSTEAEQIMVDTIVVLSEEPLDTKKLGEKIQLLREQAKKDVGKTKRK